MNESDSGKIFEFLPILFFILISIVSSNRKKKRAEQKRRGEPRPEAPPIQELPNINIRTRPPAPVNSSVAEEIEEAVEVVEAVERLPEVSLPTRKRRTKPSRTQRLIRAKRSSDMIILDAILNRRH